MVARARRGTWVTLCAASVAGSCGDVAHTSVSQGGSGTSSTGGLGSVTETSSTTSDATGTEGSMSDSATTGTTAGDSDSDSASGSTTGGAASASGSTSASTSTGDTTTLESTTASSSGGDSTGDDTGVPVDPCGMGNKWTAGADFDQGVLNNVHHDAPDGDQLQIKPGAVTTPQPLVYIPQTAEGWILKLDMSTGKQVARYPSLRTADCQICNADRSTWRPSRVIIDFDGDVYVANRAFGNQGSLTKIAGDASRCVDRNGNGVIDTSVDADQDGIIDVNDPAEYRGQNDECVLYSMPIGGNNGVPRAITLDGQGFAYVGTYTDKKAFKLDVTQSPAKLVKTIALPSTPYGFVVRGNYLYSSGKDEPVMRVDLTDNTVKTMNAPWNYGIAVDAAGIAWFGGLGLQRCDFDSGAAICDNKGGPVMNGVAVDLYGQVWAVANSGTIYKYDNAGKLLGMTFASQAYGVAIGHTGDPVIAGLADVYEIAAGPPGGPPGAVKTLYTGLVGGVKPENYTYNDFTGFTYQNVTVKKGEWTVLHDGVAPGSQWSEVVYNTEPEASVPPGTSITFQLRAADTEAGLAKAKWIAVAGGVPGEAVTGRFVQLRARLLITDIELETSPVLSDVCVVKGN